MRATPSISSRVSALLASAVLLASLYGCGSSDSPTTVATPATPSSTPVAAVSDVPVSLTDTIKAQTFSIGVANIAFVFDEATQKDVLDAAKVTQIDSIDLRGSFNGWAKTAGYTLTKSATDKGIWYLSIPPAFVKAPGNSGQPEYKFVVTGTVNGTAAATAWINVSATTPTGYAFAGNHTLVFATDDPNAIAAASTQSGIAKPLAQFDLTKDADKAAISNFRAVPGTTKLFRSYHPFKKSRAALDTEETRLTLVKGFIESTGIKTIITLSGQESADAAQNESISPYVQAIINTNHDLFLNTSYNAVYYSSNSSDFGKLMGSVVSYINDDANATPVLVHCRLGEDRTGVVTAMLAALLGTSWDDIKADYAASNNMLAQEYRDPKLLQYAFEHMLNTSITTADFDLKKAVSTYFIKGSYLTQTQIDALTAKLK